VRSEKLVAEAGDSSGNHKKGNVRRWKPLPSNAVKTVTENTSLYVMVICKVHHELFKSSINPITNPNPVYSHTHTRDNMYICMFYTVYAV
jgi:hypothetical protein